MFKKKKEGNENNKKGIERKKEKKTLSFLIALNSPITPLNPKP